MCLCSYKNHPDEFNRKKEPKVLSFLITPNSTMHAIMEAQQPNIGKIFGVCLEKGGDRTIEIKSKQGIPEKP